MASCIEDGISTDPSCQPEFSLDTLNMGMVFTQEGTSTFSFKVYNRYDKIINISTIEFEEGNAGIFRINVDGISGTSFNNVEIRPNDSIYVFVEATLPENNSAAPVTISRNLDFITAGVTRTVVLSAQGQDVERITAKVIEADTLWNGEKPYQIFDSLVVSAGATLTIAAGSTLYFHDKASMKVEGRLICNGTAEEPVNFTGDRTGDILTDVPFDLMSGQWEGLTFTHTSFGNEMSYVSIRNSSSGVMVDSIPAGDLPALKLLNCKLRNSAGYALQAIHSDINAIGCEIADAASGVLLLRGGSHIFNHCTFANYYLFSSLGGAAIQLEHINADTSDGSEEAYTEADFSNSIIYGNGADLSQGDLTGTAITLRRCLLKSAGSDDDNFIDCIWDTDPMYYTDRSAYIFDYRLQDGSPAIGAALPELTLEEAATDFYGLPRGEEPDLGAYVHVPAE